ncbi:hypothetical protein JK628_07835 [Shewanella sp. KX20019]|uniref:hypothetical protein n=1 Tax=Shewanella sp. KX20019 TaxID=2803864 RepID=UPI001925DBC4|nr:hypothetical protein [Shewanella sp. KX20019]QQX81735.1 hypothetical protein JK628_07835 [Shewanella sp. KX20019]
MEVDSDGDGDTSSNNHNKVASEIREFTNAPSIFEVFGQTRFYELIDFEGTMSKDAEEC